MPRRSSADLQVVRLPGQGRPEPPATLTGVERSAWLAVVDASPERWLDPAGQLVLRRIVAEIAIAERCEERLRCLIEAGGDLEVELEIARAHRETTKAIIGGLTALRATPRSKMTSRRARDVYARSPSGRRPWDIEAKATTAAQADEADEAEHGESPA
jgi:hypothetical protein